MVAFHPVVACSFAGFLSLKLLVVFVSIFVMADTVSVVVVFFLNPHVASSLAGFLGLVLAVIFVRAHVVADSVFVAVFVAVGTVVVMMVSASHGSDGHGEGFHVFCFEL